MSRLLVTTLLLFFGAATGVAAFAADSDSGTPSAAPPRGREVRCTIRQDGELALDAACEFRSEGGKGSFSLAACGGDGELFPGVLVVSVTVVSPGVAEVRGLTAAGANSRWGEARRSRKDPACWTGSDFEVCAR